MSRQQDTYDALVRLCQDYGYVTDHTYDLLDQVMASINDEPEEEA